MNALVFFLRTFVLLGAAFVLRGRLPRTGWETAGVLCVIAALVVFEEVWRKAAHYSEEEWWRREREKLDREEGRS